MAISKTQSTFEQYRLSLEHFVTTVRDSVYLVALAMAARGIWYWELRDRLAETPTSSDWAAVFLQSLRQDISVVGYLMLPAIVFGSLVFFSSRVGPLANGARIAAAGFFIALNPLLTYCAVGFYEAFSDSFNQRVFELFRGNAGMAIGEAISDHAFFRRLLLSLLASGCSFMIYLQLPNVKRLAHHVPGRSTVARAVITVLVIIAVVGAVRGGFGRRPIQKVDSSVTAFPVLNRGIIQPMRALTYAYRSHRMQFSHNLECPSAQEVVRIAGLLPHLMEDWPEAGKFVEGSAFQSGAIDFNAPLLQRVAGGSPNVAPSHVFLLFMESYDSWPMLETYAQMGIVQAGMKLAREGIWIRRFLPAANSSNASYAACIQGMPNTNLFDQRCLPTSLVQVFQQLGYETRQVNGFPADWDNARHTSEGQGFDRVYCAEEILAGGETSNHWLHDRTLFNFVKKLPYDQPTFSVIRSSSNHGPWEVDLERENCAIDDLPDAVAGVSIADKSKKKKTLGHAKYADRLMVDFVRTMIDRYPDSLFVITGDHYGRNFLNHCPTIFERSSVPLVLYGPQVLRGLKAPPRAAGSHIDIGPTLVELCAPRGFTYQTLGKNLLDPAAPAVGVGTGYVIFSDSIISLDEPASIEPLPWGPEKTFADASDRIVRARKLHDFYHGIGFHLSRAPLPRLEAKATVADHPVPAVVRR